MYQFRKRKYLAVLLTLSMLFSMVNTGSYAKGSLIGPDDMETDGKIKSFSEEEAGFGSMEGTTATEIYVGGGGEEDGNGSSSNPFHTLGEAADEINDMGAGSYHIIMQGDTTETSSIIFGNSSDDEFNISITVSGSAIRVNKASEYFRISVYPETKLSLEGYSETQPLIFDGGGSTYQGYYSLFEVYPEGTLILNAHAKVDNNVVRVGGTAAGIRNEGTLILNGGVVSNNTCLTGGGIINYGVMTIYDGIISNNESYFAGGIYNLGSLTMKDGTITENMGENGGGIYNEGNFLMEGGRIEKNSASELASAVYNIKIMTIDGGTITDHPDVCIYNVGSITMKDGSITENYGTVTIQNDEDASMEMIGEFKLTGGTIENNSGDEVVRIDNGSFAMSAGTIRGNEVDHVIAVFGDGECSISGGEITNNDGYAIYTEAPISLSDSASIVGKDGQDAIIYIHGDNSVNVSGELSNVSSIGIELSLLRSGRQILAGDGLTEELISKFIITNINYSIDSSGKLAYRGTALTLYVDAVEGHDENDGSMDTPLQTLKNAVDRLNAAGVGTIIVQSDLHVEENLSINADITIKADDNNRTITHSIPYSDDDFSFFFDVRSASLTLGDQEETIGDLIFDGGFSKIDALIYSKDDSVVTLYHNVVIQNNYYYLGTIYNKENCVINMDGASILNEKGVAIKNDGTLNLIAGTISGTTEDSDEFYGIVNFCYGIVNMSDGTITGNNGEYSYGITNSGDLILSGGTISDNAYGIINDGNITLSGNVTIPLATNAYGRNMVYLEDEYGGGTISLNSDLNLDEGNNIYLILDSYDIGDTILLGSAQAIIENYDKFKLANDRFGLSETGSIIYIGNRPEYYVDSTWVGDNIGTKEEPFTDISDAISAIENELGFGTIYICSDLQLSGDVEIDSDIAIVNYGEDAHVITREYYNDYMFYVTENGILTLGAEGEGDDDRPTLLLRGEAEEAIKDSYSFIYNDGRLNLYAGIKLYDNFYQKRDTSQYDGVIYNYGEIHMYGGIISDNVGRVIGGIYNDGRFIIEGGRISNCSGGTTDAIYNTSDGILRITGGRIEGNPSGTGISVYNLGTLHLSENASIPAGEDESNKIFLGATSHITLDTDLDGSEQIMLTTNSVYPGRQLLSGDENILLSNYSKFILPSSLIGYQLEADGSLRHTGEALTYYVDQEQGSDDNAGTASKPFSSLKKAVKSIEQQGGVGTIYICSDLELDEAIVIKGAITLLNSGEAHVIKYASSFSEEVDFNREDYIDYHGPSMFIIEGKLELGNVEDNNRSEIRLLTLEGNNSYNHGTLISNYGTLILHNGLVLEGNTSRSENGAMYNEGYLIMNGGVIQNNTARYKGGAIENIGSIVMNGGAIQDNHAEYGGGAIYNQNGSFIMNGGVIQDNDTDYGDGGAIYNNNGSFIMNGGNIQNNSTQNGGVIENYNYAEVTITGGSISENNCGALLFSYNSSFNMSGGMISDNDGTGVVLSNSTGIMSGGVISGNQSPDETYDYRKGIVVYPDATLTLLKDASITGGDDVTLNNYTGEPEPVITIGASLSEDTPEILITRVMIDYTYTEEPYYQPGDQILIPADGYSLTIKDSSKFKLRDSSYAINSQGRITGALNENWFSLVDADSLHYTGDEIRPDVIGSNGSILLEEGRHYQLSYRNNINVGTATVVIYGMGNYGGRVTKTFTIHKAAIQSIITSAPADQTFSADEGMTLEQLRQSIGLSSVMIQWSKGTELLPITWTLTSGSYNPKGGSYTFTGILGESDKLDTEGKTLTTTITVTSFTLSKPIFEDTTISVSSDGQLTAEKLGNTVLPTSGTLQVGNTSVSYTIAWDESTLDGRTVGASNTFRGTINYTNAPDWATLPTDRSVSRKVSVLGSNTGPTPTPPVPPTIPVTPTPPITPKPIVTPTPTVGPTPSGDFDQRTVDVSFKTEQDSQSGALNVRISLSEASVQELSDMSGEGGKTIVTIPIDSEEIEGLMRDDSLNSVNFEVELPKGIADNPAIADYRIQLSADIINAARETEKDLHISVKDEEGKERYSWSFDGASLAASDQEVTDLNLSLQVERAEEHPELAELLSRNTGEDQENGNNIIISLGHHGALPAQASVRIYVGDMGFSAGDRLYLYYFNPETGKLETLPHSTNYRVDENGYITVNIIHCSDYVLLPQEADSSMITSLRNQINVDQESILLYLGSDQYSKSKINVKLPSTLEQVASLKDKTSGSAVGAVVIKYKSGNSKIVSIDSSGNIVAKKAGKTFIKVTATLYNGKTKTFTIPVAVEKASIRLVNSTEHMKLGESYTFTAEAFGLDTGKIEWKTSKKSIVVINKKTGKATAAKKGTDYVVASIGDMSIKVKVTVE